MRWKTHHKLAVAAFIALAVAFDGFGVAAIFVEFGGILRVLLATICVLVGTVSAFVLTAPLIRKTARRRDIEARS